MRGRTFMTVLGGAGLGILLYVLVERYGTFKNKGENKGEVQDSSQQTTGESLVQFKDEGDVPENAAKGCPGVDSAEAGKADACEGCPNRSICATGTAGNDAALERIKSTVAYTLKGVKHKILVLSGKGGVGKSTIATQLAWALQSQGNVVGLLDIDICGPSVPRMTGSEERLIKGFEEGWLPVPVTPNFLVMSAGYMLPEKDGAIIWRGPKKNGLIKQFLTDVYWGSLEYLIIDTPPGTSDEHLSIVTHLAEAKIDGAIVVTTPQEVSLLDVRKELTFCKQTRIRVLGVVENMTNSVFSSIDPEGTRRTCVKMNVPYAGCVAMDAHVVEACEKGQQIAPDSNPGQQIQAIIDKCIKPLDASCN